MPLRRYEIRNEYSLADPELYRAADRDDPEALLEGVAMAGLVGVLRQLGDLAEFAAEIFHDLHEELMATAARGHGLTLRVQQLEAEFPSIEKSFLSQTNQSMFIRNSGVNWHPNLRIDQNLISRGDLPRFVMDSYEECRGPPRLFLLDKFDIAGAGACLKRYSDPSFFRAEFASSKATKEEAKREKRSRKIKKKVPRWKNIETPESASSRIQLHQLFSEEQGQSDNIVRTHHVKLKRRHSSNLLADTITGKSYMERFLPSPPDQKSICENSASPFRLKVEPTNSGELVPEIHDIHSITLASKTLMRNESPLPSPRSWESAFDPPNHEFLEDVLEEGYMKKSPEMTPDIVFDSIPSTLHKVEDVNELVVYGEGKVEAIIDGYRSDDATSEMENYVDALATMDSEMETESDSKLKNEHGSKVQKKWVDSATNEEQKVLEAQFSDSHSMRSSLPSDDGIDSFKKGRLSLSYSDTSSNSAENVLSDREAAKLHSCTTAETFVSSSKMISEVGNADGSTFSEHALPSGSCNNVSENPSYASQYRECFKSDATGLTSAMCDSNISSSHVNSIGESLPRTEVDGGNTANALPCSKDVSNTPLQSRDNSLSVRSHRSLPIKLVDSGAPDISDDALKHMHNILNPADEEKDIDGAVVSEATLQTNDADYNHIEYFVNEKTDLSDSVTLQTEEEKAVTHGLAQVDVTASSNKTVPESTSDSQEAVIHCLGQEDVTASSNKTVPESIPDSPADGYLVDVRPDGIVLEIGNVIRSSNESECLVSCEGSRETCEFGDQKLPEGTDQVPPLAQDFAENSASSELETARNNLEIGNVQSGKDSKCMASIVGSPENYDCENQKLPEGTDHVHSLAQNFGEVDSASSEPETVCNNLESKDESAPNGVWWSCTDRNVDTFLDTQVPCNVSDVTDPISAADTLQVAVQTADVGDTFLDDKSTCLLFGDQMKLQESLPSDTDSHRYKLDSSEVSSLNHLVGSDAEDKAENKPTVSLSDYNIERVDANPNHLYQSNGTDAPLSTKGSDQELEQKENPQSHLSGTVIDTVPPSIHLLEQVPLEEGIELESEKSNGLSSQEVGDTSRLLYHLNEETESLNQIDCDGHSDAVPISSSSNPLGQPSDMSLLPPPSYRLESSDPSTAPLQRLSHGIALLPEATNQVLLDQQPHIPALDNSFPDHNTLPATVEESPPLPPLPPMQWRIGKLRHGFLSSEGEMFQHSLNPSSPLSTEAADGKAQQGFLTIYGQVTHPLNPFLELPNADDEKLPHDFQMLGKETLRPSLSPSSSLVPVLSLEKNQPDFHTLNTTTQPLNPFLPLADEEPPHDSSNLGGDVLQPTSSGLLEPSSTLDNAYTWHVSKSSQEEVEQSLDLANRSCKEDKQLHSTFPVSQQEKMQPVSSLAPPTIEDEKPEHVPRTLEGEMTWQSHLYAVMPTVEDEKPNGTHKSRLARPRDPLIEAVASHDKSNLKKVTERVLPQVEPKVDERNSLLEQIRSKSFNLKPAAVTRPNIKGPQTNLKVVAILEKANAIRQALAGSDDDDTWSDS